MTHEHQYPPPTGTGSRRQRRAAGVDSRFFAKAATTSSAFVTALLCGVTVAFGWLQSGDAASSGSGENTSPT